MRHIYIYIYIYIYLCLCVHILSLVHVVSLDICEVKIVAKACIQKISELPLGIEPVSPDCRFGCFTSIDYRASDSNAMLTRDLVPTVFMCPLYLKAHHTIL